MPKILHVTEDHSVRNTGVTRVVDLLAGTTAAKLGAGGCVHILATGEEFVTPPPYVRFTAEPISRLGRPWRWSRALAEKLRYLIRSEGINVVHLHGVWMAPQWLGAKVAYDIGVPFILTAHDMLTPWRWNEQGFRKRLKKRVYWQLLAYRAFCKASVIHAITPREREYLRELFPGQRIEVIPNAIDLQEVDALTGREVSESEPFIFFLGRVHHSKGIDILIKAFAEAKLDSKWRLVIAGPPQDQAYLSALKAMVGAFGIERRVEFIGPVYGEEKDRWLKRAWVLALPSHSEVIGMVNLEAAACRTPTITTHETGLWDWEEGGGLLIRPDVKELCRALGDACAWSGTERRERGQASRELVRRRYALDVTLDQWLSLYRNVAANG